MSNLKKNHISLHSAFFNLNFTIVPIMHPARYSSSVYHVIKIVSPVQQAMIKYPKRLS